MPRVRFGVLTGGGDCPGLNAAIRAIVRKGIDGHGHELVGFRHGWRGPIEGDWIDLTIDAVRGILPRGGTILRSSRTNPLKREDGIERIRETMDELSLDGLIAIGGEDTLGAAQKLHEAGVPVLGLPKTIDNDLNGTDLTFGFDTAVQIATDAIDRLHTTAESHNRVLVVEVMGRHAGWIALHSGIAGGADVILIPERPFDIDVVCTHLKRRHERGRYFSIVVAAEGATPREGTLATLGGDKDEFGHERLGGIGQVLEREVEARTGFETRATVLGTRPARRHADRVRPRARHALRHRRDRRRDRGPVGHDDGAARDEDRARPAGGRRGVAQDRPARGLRGGRGVLRLARAAGRGRGSSARTAGRRTSRRRARR